MDERELMRPVYKTRSLTRPSTRKYARITTNLGKPSSSRTKTGCCPCPLSFNLVPYSQEVCDNFDTVQLDGKNWCEPAEELFMELWMKEKQVCDINKLLQCTPEISPNPDVPPEWKCKCREQSSRLENPAADLKKGVCVADVAHPCDFHKRNLSDQLSGTDYKCGKNMACIKIGTQPEQTTLERVSKTAGYPTDTTGWFPPMTNYILRRIDKVCACVNKFAHNSNGECIPIDTARKARSSIIPTTANPVLIIRLLLLSATLSICSLP